jgi:2-dehydropantoate 2-reductase
VRYVIIGAGAVGGTIGALLVESEHDVVLVARGAHLRALRETGLRLATPRGVTTSFIPTIAGPDEIDLRADDVLLLCVKSQDTAAALAGWADRPVAGGGVAADVLPVVCAQNGVENERIALRRFARVYGMSVMLPAGHVEPGLVTAVSDPVVGVLMIGRYPSGTDQTATHIAADLSASRLVAPIIPDIQRWKYAKLLRNLGNAIDAVCGTLGDDPDVGRLRDLAVQEATAVLAAAGIEGVGDAEQDRYRSLLRSGDVPQSPRGGGSSWQSLARGTGTIESDYLNGEIVLIARLNDLPAPVNSRLQRLARQAATAGRAPGSVTAGQILADLQLNGAASLRIDSDDHRPNADHWPSTTPAPGWKSGWMRRFAQVDVFTTQAGFGNPVAVVLDAEGMDDEAMARFANWTNLSETTFVLPTTTTGADYRVRIFTPTEELPMAGHPTLGTCRALLDAGVIPDRDQWIQETAAGLIEIRRDQDDGLSFRAPTALISDSPLELAVLAQVLGGVEPADPMLIEIGPRWLTGRLDLATLDTLQVDPVLFLQTLPPTLSTGINLYAVDDDRQVHVRSFFDGGGVLVEDPVCGSGNAAVGAHLLRTGHADDVPATYQARQGRHRGRDGRIQVTPGERVWVGGQAVTVITGTLADSRVPVLDS